MVPDKSSSVPTGVPFAYRQSTIHVPAPISGAPEERIIASEHSAATSTDQLQIKPSVVHIRLVVGYM